MQNEKIKFRDDQTSGHQLPFGGSARPVGWSSPCTCPGILAGLCYLLRTLASEAHMDLLCTE